MEWEDHDVPCRLDEIKESLFVAIVHEEPDLSSHLSSSLRDIVGDEAKSQSLHLLLFCPHCDVPQSTLFACNRKPSLCHLPDLIQLHEVALRIKRSHVREPSNPISFHIELLFGSQPAGFYVLHDFCNFRTVCLSA